MRKLFSENNFFENTCSLVSHDDIGEINISKSWIVQFEKLLNILRKDSSDEEVFLGSCCLVIIIKIKSKEKGKGRGFGKYLKEE